MENHRIPGCQECRRCSVQINVSYLRSMFPNGDLRPARLLRLVSLLARDRLISHNGKGFLKELILRRDPAVIEVFAGFGSHPDFLEQVNELIDRESRRLFDDLFADCSLSEGKSLSKAERRRKGLLGDKGLIYGEVDFSSFATVLREVMARMPSDPREIFYDLGSGTGKAVYVARLTQDFAHCVGIELLEPLHSAAQRVTDLYNSKFRRRLDSTRPQNAAVYSGSFLEYDWSDGDVVFANSTCFPDDLMERLTNQAEELKPGAIVITFTKMLESPCFDMLQKTRFDMSWGPATVFIHRRRPRGDYATNRTPPPVSSSNAPRGAICSAEEGGDASNGIRGNRKERQRGSPRTARISTEREFQGGQGRNRGAGLEVGSFGMQEEQEGKSGDAQGISPDGGVLLFDAQQGRKGQVGDENNAAPMNKRFTEFRELLKLAEKKQQEVFQQLKVSREELMALPGELETDCLGDVDVDSNRKPSGMLGEGRGYNRETDGCGSGNSIIGGVGRGDSTSSRSGSGNDRIGIIGVTIATGCGAAASPDDAGGCCDRASHPPSFFNEEQASLIGKTTEVAPAPAPIAKVAAVEESAGGIVDGSNASGRQYELRGEVGDGESDPRVGNAPCGDDVEGAGSVAAAAAAEENVDKDDHKGINFSEDGSEVVAAAGLIGKGLGEGGPLGADAVESENMRNEEASLGGWDGRGLVPLTRQGDDDEAEMPPTGDINGGGAGGDNSDACGNSEQEGLLGTPVMVVGERRTRMLNFDTAFVSAGEREECSREQPHQACALSSVGAAATGVSTSSSSCPPRDYDNKSHGKRAEALSHDSSCGDRADEKGTVDDIDPVLGAVTPPPPPLPSALSSNSSVSRHGDNVGQLLPLPLLKLPVSVSDGNDGAVPEEGT